MFEIAFFGDMNFINVCDLSTCLELLTDFYFKLVLIIVTTLLHRSVPVNDFDVYTRS